MASRFLVFCNHGRAGDWFPTGVGDATREHAERRAAAYAARNPQHAYAVCELEPAPAAAPAPTIGDHRARAIAAAASAALAGGDRAAMIAALAAIDPNGCWLDADSAADDLPPVTAAEAAAALSAMLSNP